MYEIGAVYNRNCAITHNDANRSNLRMVCGSMEGQAIYFGGWRVSLYGASSGLIVDMWENLGKFELMREFNLRLAVGSFRAFFIF
jgi:hypothetical protein